MIHWEQALELETRVAQIIHQQEKNGVRFDVDKAKQYINELDEKRKELYEEIRPSLEIEIVRPSNVPVNKPFLKASGKPIKRVIDWMGEDSYLVAGPFSKVLFSEPDIGSRQKVIKQLLKHGWKPESYTETGQPKLTQKGQPVKSLFKIENGIGELIAKWFVYRHRQSQIEGWIRDLREDGRITAAADSCGTPTARMRHKILVNVPKAKPQIVFGYQMRSLFIADKEEYLIGYDASALEARMEAHYTWPYDDGEYAKELLDGDIHSKNAEIFNCIRDTAKNGKYCLTYGGYPTKLAQTLGCKKSEANKYFDDFWEKNYALGKLRERVIRMADNLGYLPGLDGRKLYVRSSHSALNLLFQSAGSIIMKKTMVLLDDWIKKEGLHHKKLIDMHDESQAGVPKDEVIFYELDTEEELKEKEEELKEGNKIIMSSRKIDGKFRTGYSRYGELAILAIKEAGTLLGIRCPLDGQYIIGNNWAETH